MSPRNVLIVEDELIIQMHLSRIVEAAGHRVSGTAETCAEALAAAEREAPDLALVDIHLRGEGHGIDAARVLREKYDCAVVFATAHADTATLERTQGVEAAGYIVKPFTNAAVLAAITTALASRERIHVAEERERSYASVLTKMSGGVLVADQDRIVSFLNPQAADLIGCEAHDACDRDLLEVLRFGSEGQSETFASELQACLDAREPETIAGLEVRRADGTTRTVRIQIEPIFEGSAPSTGAIIALQERAPAIATSIPSSATEQPFGSGTRLLVYSHDTFGLGHLQRSLNLIGPLLEKNPGLSVLLVTGSAVAHRFELPKGADYVKLPTVEKVGQDEYASRSLRISDGGILNLRSNLLLNTVRDYEPNVLLVDHSPTGMSGELLPALEFLREQGNCQTILGLRDIIDTPAAVQRRWNKQGIYDVLRDLYDHIVIYGAREVYDAAKLYEFPESVAERTSYVGYVSGVRKDAEPWPSQERPLIAVSIGGGDGGDSEVIGTYLDMLDQYRDEIDFDTEIVTGPLLPVDRQEHYRERASGYPVRVRDFLPTMIPLFSGADLVVSTGGYNTSTQLLRYAKRAVMIPRILHRDEQLIRAVCLDELGLVDMLHPEKATAETLYAAIRRALAGGEPLTEGREHGRIPLDGALGMAEFCSKLRVRQTER